MPKTILSLPDGNRYEFYYLRDKNILEELVYFQSIRSGKIDEQSALSERYHGIKRNLAWQLSKNIKQFCHDFSAIVSPPSSRQDADIYVMTVKEWCSGEDISGRFSPRGKFKSQNPSTTFENMIEEFKYEPRDDERNFESVLIIDEMVGSGKTLAALITRLRAAGLSDAATIILAAPAWARSATATS